MRLLCNGADEGPPKLQTKRSAGDQRQDNAGRVGDVPCGPLTICNAKIFNYQWLRSRPQARCSRRPMLRGWTGGQRPRVRGPCCIGNDPCLHGNCVVFLSCSRPSPRPPISPQLHSTYPMLPGKGAVDTPALCGTLLKRAGQRDELPHEAPAQINHVFE